MSLTKDNWILSPELLKLVKVSRDLFGRFCLALPCLVLAILQIKYKKQLIYLDLLLDYILPSLSCLGRLHLQGSLFDCLVLVDQY